MDGLLVATVSIVAMLVLIFVGLHIAVVLSLISFISVWVIRGDITIAVTHLWGAAAQTVNSSVFAVVPLFVLMGLLAGEAGLGRDAFDLAHRLLHRVRGGLAMATVGANAIFAAITGVSIASASIFAKLAVPEMLRNGYRTRFAVGTVAGSSVLGMLIPPSVLMIVYGIIAEESIGDLFIAGIVPGIVLSAAYCLLISLLAYWRPGMVFVSSPEGEDSTLLEKSSRGQLWSQACTLGLLVGIVLGGIYGGVFTPMEAAGIGAFVAFIIALFRRTLNVRRLMQLLVETGEVTCTILFLVVGASMYSRMLGVSGLPTEISNLVTQIDAGLWMLLATHVVICLLLGTIIDSVSVMLITVPLFLVVLKPFQVDLVWLGIVTVIAVEIGLLTPPFGIAVFVVHSTLARSDVTPGDVFIGAAPFALVMLAVLLLVIAFPPIATFLVHFRL